jgi:hypothetical protein
MADAVTDAMIEAFQRERNEWHSAEIREILSEYETWRQSLSQVPAEDVKRLIERLEREPVLVADQEPFVEIWEADFKQILSALRSLTALQVTEGDKRDIIFGILARRAFNEELLGHVIEATDEICAALQSKQEGEG